MAMAPVQVGLVLAFAVAALFVTAAPAVIVEIHAIFCRLRAFNRPLLFLERCPSTYTLCVCL